MVLESNIHPSIFRTHTRRRWNPHTERDQPGFQPRTFWDDRANLYTTMKLQMNRIWIISFERVTKTQPIYCWFFLNVYDVKLQGSLSISWQRWSSFTNICTMICPFWRILYETSKRKTKGKCHQKKTGYSYPHKTLKPWSFFIFLRVSGSCLTKCRTLTCMQLAWNRQTKVR